MRMATAPKSCTAACAQLAPWGGGGRLGQPSAVELAAFWQRAAVPRQGRVSRAWRADSRTQVGARSYAVTRTSSSSQGSRGVNSNGVCCGGRQQEPGRRCRPAASNGQDGVSTSRVLALGRAWFKPTHGTVGLPLSARGAPSPAAAPAARSCSSRGPWKKEERGRTRTVLRRRGRRVERVRACSRHQRKMLFRLRFFARGTSSRSELVRPRARPRSCTTRPFHPCCGSCSSPSSA